MCKALKMSSNLFSPALFWRYVHFWLAACSVSVGCVFGNVWLLVRLVAVSVGRGSTGLVPGAAFWLLEYPPANNSHIFGFLQHSGSSYVMTHFAYEFSTL